MSASSEWTTRINGENFRTIDRKCFAAVSSSCDADGILDKCFIIEFHMFRVFRMAVENSRDQRAFSNLPYFHT